MAPVLKVVATSMSSGSFLSSHCLGQRPQASGQGLKFLLTDLSEHFPTSFTTRDSNPLDLIATVREGALHVNGLYPSGQKESGE